MKEVYDIQDILKFIDRKISYLKENLDNVVPDNLESKAEVEGLQNQISRWKNKKNELNELTENIIDEQIKTLTQ